MTGPEEDVSHLGLRHRRVSHTDSTNTTAYAAASSFNSRQNNGGGGGGVVLPLSMRLMRPLIQ